MPAELVLEAAAPDAALAGPRPAAALRFVLSAVMYSPNLGDGVIAACFSHAARQYEPAPVRIDWLDLAGRTGFASGGDALRARALGVLTALPPRLSDAVSAALVGRQIEARLAPLAQSMLDDASGLIVGGGQLLNDVNLNFPLKLARLTGLAERRYLPTALNAVGVSQSWSARARELFRGPLTSPGLRFVSVRDLRSRENLAGHYRQYGSRLPEIAIHPDPGFLAAEAFPRDGRPAGETVGIGVTHPAVLRNHGAASVRENAAGFARSFVALGRLVAAEGFAVEFFTNGSPEDEECLAEVARLLPPEDAGLRVAARAGGPGELIGRIAGYRAIVSHRMHASIVACSYRIPFVGLAWDAKMEGVFDVMARRPSLVDGSLADPRSTVRALLASIAEPFDDARHAELVRDARRGVEAVLAALNTGAGNGPGASLPAG
jgi:polysaccharide pyruvyl transferase WcaK-like protein